MADYASYARYPISVDSVIFGYAEGELKVALIQRNKEPFKGMWAIPGGFMEMGESIEAAARRELKEETGIESSYLEHFGVYSAPGRDPRGPTITVALFALIHSDQCSSLVATEDAAKAKWFSAYKVPVLAFDHSQIYQEALEALRVSFRTRPVAFELLPSTFTLSQLQDLYEQIFDLNIDKRNFRKRIQKMEFILPTHQKTQGGRHRPALLYRFDSKRYNQVAKETVFN